jgi:hypothetical protein
MQAIAPVFARDGLTFRRCAIVKKWIYSVSRYVRPSTPAVPALSDVSSSSGTECGSVCTLSSGGESSQSATDDTEGENLLAEAYGNGHGLIVGED